MIEYEEVLRQEYSENKCIFSAGFVTGHAVDTMYIRLEREGEEPVVILFRPDEMASIAWLASGVLWSNEMRLLTSRAADLLPCGHPRDRLNIDYTSMNCWCMDCEAATSR